MKEGPGRIPLSEVYKASLQNLQSESDLVCFWIQKNIAPNKISRYEYYTTTDNILSTNLRYNSESLNRDSKVSWALHHGTNPTTFMFAALSKSIATSPDPRYYPPTSISYFEKTQKLCLDLPILDSKLFAFVPHGFYQHRTRLSYGYNDSIPPVWSAVEYDSRSKPVNEVLIPNSAPLDNIFLDAAQRGQLPGIMNPNQNFRGSILPPPPEYPNN